jgi:hypothetical protein
MTIGDVAVTLGKPNPTGKQIPIASASQYAHYESTCSETCTSAMRGPVTVFGQFLHMHR